MQLFIMSGISWFIVSRYSSKLPPNSLGWPFIWRRPIRLRRGGFAVWAVCLCWRPFSDVGESPEASIRIWRICSCFASNRAMRLVPRMYSLNFCKTDVNFISVIHEIDFLLRILSFHQGPCKTKSISIIIFIKVSQIWFTKNVNKEKNLKMLETGYASLNESSSSSLALQPNVDFCLHNEPPPNLRSEATFRFS
jgi:hypothetical protein